jgi:hypothetical protein
MGQDYLLPRRAMLQTSIDEGTGEARAFLIMPNNIIVPSVVEELQPCLSFKNSELHAELGYDEGFYKPNEFSTSAQYVAELIYNIGPNDIAQHSAEIEGLSPNAGSYFVVGTTSCGMDCKYPFIFDIRSGREVSIETKLIEKFNNEELANFSFTMAHDDGRFLLSWRDRSGSCVLQKAQIQENRLTVQTQHITPAGQYLFDPSVALNCPAT